MGRRKKLMVWGIVIAVVAIIIIAATIIIKHDSSEKELKAVQIAQEYLAQKYEQKMIYESVRYSWVDPGQYHVYFLSEDTEIWFEVSMWPKALDFSEIPTDDYIWDNYFNNFFCRKLEEILLPEAKSIWDDDVSIQVVLSSGKGYSQRVTAIPSERMTVTEMEPIYNYEFFIKSNRILNDESKTKEAERILYMIQCVKSSQYQPREILFWYQSGVTEKGEKVEEHIWFGDRSDPCDIEQFENWFEITSVDQIIKIMNYQWFNK